MIINTLIVKNYFDYHCSYCFIFPLIKLKDLFKEIGIKINFFFKISKNIFDCDVLLIESRYFERLKNKKKFIEFLNHNSHKNLRKIFVDTADNSGQIKNDILPFVDDYWKGQIVNKKNYLNKHYGGRLFTDYYHKNFSTKDSKPLLSNPVNKKYLKKISVSWNMGLTNYGMFSHIYQKLFSITKFRIFIKNEQKLHNANNSRNIDFSCRIGTNYERNTVAFQRKTMLKFLPKSIDTNKVRRTKYLNEMKNSKFTISPFGWGELCPRDFESFICGSILIKPNMSDFKTWPNWYLNNKTYIPFDWNFRNLKEVIEYSMDNYKRLMNIAITAQNMYFKFAVSKDSENIFLNRFKKLLNK